MLSNASHNHRDLPLFPHLSRLADQQ